MKATDVRPFVQTGNTVSIAAGVASASIAITNPASRNTELPGTMLVVNDGTQTAFITQGPTAPTADTTGIPVKAGTTQTFEMKYDTAFVAAIAPGGNTTLYFTPGQGS